jgi:putative FmdB family regulatory protein
VPTYTYECAACGHRFDLMQSITAKQLRKCPACGQRKLDRLIGTGAGLIFKGSGFYTTDYRSPAPSGDDAAKPESKSDAKPESKPESKSKPERGSAPDAKDASRPGKNPAT